MENENTAQAVAVDSDLITKGELAARIKKTQRTVDVWMAKGILPYYKLGRTVMFRWSVVLAHLEAYHRVGVK